MRFGERIVSTARAIAHVVVGVGQDQQADSCLGFTEAFVRGQGNVWSVDMKVIVLPRLALVLRFLPFDARHSNRY